MGEHSSLQLPNQDIDLEGVIHHGRLQWMSGSLDPEMNGHLSKTHESLVEHLHLKTGILHIYFWSTQGHHRLSHHLTLGRLHLLGRGRLHLDGRGWRHLLGLSGRGRRHLLPPSLPWWLAWRHALAWGRRSSCIHFLVTEDGSAGVLLVPRLTKFLAGQDLYCQDDEPSGNRSRASEPVSAQESSRPQKSCCHNETCDCSYIIQNTKCPTTPMSCSILKKLWIVRIFIYLYNLYNWYPLTIIKLISLFMQATHIISHQTKVY
jgi:hypothetical protein